MDKRSLEQIQISELVLEDGLRLIELSLVQHVIAPAYERARTDHTDRPDKTRSRCHADAFQRSLAQRLESACKDSDDERAPAVSQRGTCTPFSMGDLQVEFQSRLENLSLEIEPD
jgi:hypothetical protein